MVSNSFTMALFCTACGTQLKTDEKFCTSCGQAQQPFSSSTSTVPKKEKSKKINYKALIFSIIAVAIFCVVAVYSSKNDDAIEKNNTAIDSYDKGGDPAEAINNFNEAAQQGDDKTKVEALKNLAFTYAGEGSKEKALEKFKEALSLVRNNSVDYYLVSGNIAQLEGNSSKALEYYNRALTLDPDDLQTNNSLGTFYLGLQDDTDKFTDYKKALKYNQKAYDLSKLETAKENLALTYFFLENYDKAISLFLETNLQAKADNNYWLGLSYLAKEDLINGRKYLERAVDLGKEVPPEVQSFLDNPNL